MHRSFAATRPFCQQVCKSFLEVPILRVVLSTNFQSTRYSGQRTRTNWFIHHSNEVHWCQWLARLFEHLSNNPSIIVNGFVAASIPQSLDERKPVLCTTIPFSDKPHQPKSFRFPQCEFSKTRVAKRSFQPQWFDKWMWSHYEDGYIAFCYTCIVAQWNNHLHAVSNLE